MLDYDNSAFYYFAITMILIYVLPGSWYAISEVLYAFFDSGETGTTKERTKMEITKANKLKAQISGVARLKKSWYIINLLCLVVAWGLLVYLISLVMRDGQVSRFDPYQILGIETGATISEIKKSYRKLSLKYHPDKNIGDKLAEEMFMKIAKAYESLTDETSKENYEKYGNPDGKQALEVSIGLPRILLDNPKVVLVLYLIAMVIVIPCVVGLWYANSKLYGEKNIMYETYGEFRRCLNSSCRIKNIPEVLATSAEFRSKNVPRPDEMDSLAKLSAKLIKEKIFQPRDEDPAVYRGNLLLHAHLTRMTDSLTTDAKKDLEDMLVKSPELLESIIEIAFTHRWLDTSISAIKFSQCLVQGLWIKNHSLEQLPYINESDVKLITKATPKSSSTAKTLGEYLRIPDADKKGLVRFDEEEKAEILKACQLIPNLRVETKLFVEDEEDNDFVDEKETVSKDEVKEVQQPSGDQIYEGDLVTIRVTLNRENLPEPTTGSKPVKTGPVYAPLFPKVLSEGWWIVLTDKAKGSEVKSEFGGNIHHFEKISDPNRVIVHDLKFLAPPQVGSYEMQLQIFSDCYMGLDQSVSIQFTVLSAADLPEYIPHPEDVELDNEPTLFEQVMAANADDSSDDENEDNNKDGGSKGKGSKGSKSLSQGKEKDSSVARLKKSAKGKVVEEVDDGSEEDT